MRDIKVCKTVTDINKLFWGNRIYNDSHVKIVNGKGLKRGGDAQGFREAAVGWHPGLTQGFPERDGGGQGLPAPRDFTRRPEEENSPNRRQWEEQTRVYWRNKLV